MSIAAGSRLGPYEILAPLGAGGMGEVYRARDTRLAREVAIKILPATLAGDPVHVERFRREARAVAALTHPHIVTIYSVDEAEGLHFLTMELIDGQSLDRAVPPEGAPLDLLLEIGMALADALAAAHERGIVHRDLKPGNVLIDRHGRVKVLDFGLAKDVAIDADALGETRAPLTHAGLVVGTMPYMAPEQIDGRAIDARTDLFALGVVLYELATGERPFAGDSSALLMTAILRDAPPPVAARRPDLPAGFARLVARCLEKRPNDRIQTARDVYNELRALQRESPPVAAGTSVRRESVARREPSSGAGQAGLWIAVRPFAVRSGDAESTALAEGMTEAVTAGLARFSYLRVTSSPERARYLIEGSVRRARSLIRVSAEAREPGADLQLWGERYDRDLQSSNVFELQDDLSARVIAAIGDSNGVLVRAMTALLRDRPVDQLTTFELFVRQAAYAHHQRDDEHARLRAAFESRADTEPGNAEVWGSLASLYLSEHIVSANVLPDTLGRTLRAGQRAVELDPACQAGWYAIAAAHFFRGDVDGFHAAAERTIALNPLNTNAVAFIAHLTAYAGEWERGMELLQRVMDLNPHHPGWFFFMPFNDSYRRGEYERAAQVLKRANLPEHVWTLVNTVAVAAELGRWTEARAAAETMRHLKLPHVDPRVARAELSKFIADVDHVDRLVRSFERGIKGGPAGDAPISA